METTILYIAYYAVAFFYLVCGALLIVKPRLVRHKIQAFFPVLVSLKYSETAQSLNLIFVGGGLMLVAKFLVFSHVLGFYLALILSALEVYLGVIFYYYELKNTTQAVIHVGIHSVLVVVIITVMLNYHSDTIAELYGQSSDSWTAALYNVFN